MIRRTATAALAWAVIAVGATTTPVPGSPGAGSGTGPSGALASHVPGELIVKLRDDLHPADKGRLLERLDAIDLTPIGSSGLGLARLREPDVARTLALLRDDPAVEFVEPNYLYQTQDLPNDPDLDRLWGLSNNGQTGGTPGADVSAEQAWDITAGDPSTVVAVLDSRLLTRWYGQQFLRSLPPVKVARAPLDELVPQVDPYVKDPG